MEGGGALTRLAREWTQHQPERAQKVFGQCPFAPPGVIFGLFHVPESSQELDSVLVGLFQVRILSDSTCPYALINSNYGSPVQLIL